MINLSVIRILVVASVSFLLLSLFFVKNISAQQEPAELQVTVDHVAGNFEKLKEKLFLFIRFNKESRARYQQFLVEKRLAELAYVIESDQIDRVEETASRYTTYAGNLANFVEAKKVSGVKKDVLEMYGRHEVIILDLQKNFEFESGWWLAIQHGINSTKIFSDQIKDQL